MKLSFGNMTVEMNIFIISKQQNTETEMEEVDLIQTLSKEYFEKEFVSGIMEKDKNLEESGEWESNRGENDEKPMTQRIPKLEPLEPLHEEPSTSVSHLSTPERKAWPSDLKYVFLGEREGLLVVIFSSLTPQQE